MRQVALCNKWIAYNQDEIEKAKAELVNATDSVAVDRQVQRVMNCVRHITQWERSRKDWLEWAEKDSK